MTHNEARQIAEIVRETVGPPNSPLTVHLRISKIAIAMNEHPRKEATVKSRPLVGTL